MSHIDYENYRKMQEPLNGSVVAEAALENFFNAVEKARNEFHIMDVHVITKICILIDGEEHHALSSGHFGNELEAIPMCAYELGKQQKHIDELVGKHLRGNK